jgi:hypothetical protein
VFHAARPVLHRPGRCSGRAAASGIVASGGGGSGSWRTVVNGALRWLEHARVDYDGRCDCKEALTTAKDVLPVVAVSAKKTPTMNGAVVRLVVMSAVSGMC